MYKLFVASLLVTAVLAGPADIKILRQDQVVNPDGTYQYAYETENGIAAQEQGGLKQIGPEAGTAAQGSFAYTSPEGIPIQMQYVADENGFQVTGNAVPTPPPIPIAILRSLEWNAAHPEEEQDLPVRITRIDRINY